jgi:hypothetical protein
MGENPRFLVRLQPLSSKLVDCYISLHKLITETSTAGVQITRQPKNDSNAQNKGLLAF